MYSSLLVVLVATSLATDAKPKALQQFEHYRRSLISGQVEWTLVYARDRSARGELRFRERFARNGDLIFEELGDRDGWTQWDEHGRGWSIAPRLYMLNKAGFWYRRANNTSAVLWRGARSAQEIHRGHPKDIRSLGFTDTDGCLELDEGGPRLWLAKSSANGKIPEIKWQERLRDDGLREVVATTLDDGSARTWLLDPERGWNATRVYVMLADGTVTSEVVMSLRRYGTEWFPESAAFFESVVSVDDAISGGVATSRLALHHTIIISAASFNQKDDKRSLTATDLGVEVGGTVDYRAGPPSDMFPGPVGRSDFWIGGRAVSYQEFRKLHAEGKVELGPISAAYFRGEDPEIPYTTPEERQRILADNRELAFIGWKQLTVHPWREFARELTVAVGFSDDQRESLNGIVGECIAKAGKHLDTKKVQYLEYENNLKKAKKDKDQDAIRRLERCKQELDAPMRDLFEKELKPRALALLNADQRERWNNRSLSTQPARK